jgi:preprotein translocase subunit SecG
MNVFIGMLTVVHVLVALFLIVLVLMQKSSEQGVGAAFGGGFTDSVFGAGTTTALVRLTIWCACILLATTLLLAILHSRSGGGTVLRRVPMQTAPEMPAPANAVQPVIPATSGTPTTPVTPATPASSAPATPVIPAAPATTTPAPTTPAQTPQPEQGK